MKKNLMILAAIYSFSAFTQAETKDDFVNKYTQMKYQDMNNSNDVNAIIWQFRHDVKKKYAKNIAARIDKRFQQLSDDAWNICGRNAEEHPGNLEFLKYAEGRYNETVLKGNQRMISSWAESVEKAKRSVERSTKKKQQCETSVYDLFVKPVLENKDLEEGE